MAARKKRSRKDLEALTIEDQSTIGELEQAFAEVEAQRKANAAAFRAEWEAAMASRPAPAPIAPSSLHQHDEGCWTGEVVERWIAGAGNYAGKVCQRTGVFLPERPVATRA